MADTINNKPEILDDGLDNLPEGDRKETKEIIDEAQKEEDKKNPPEGPSKKPVTDVKPKEEKPEDKKPEDGKPGEKKPGEVEPPRKPGLMPSWVHERAKKDWDAEKAGLQKQIADLSTGKPEEGKPKEVSKEAEAELEKEIEKVAKEHDLDPKLVKSLVDLGMKFGGKLPPEISEKLSALDKLKEDAETKAEETAFDKSFDEYVAPLIKKEYGDDIASDTILKIKEKLKEHAYTDEYKATPYSVIYRGIEAFREFGRPAGGAEGSRGGFQKTGEGKTEPDFDNVTEEDIEKMDPATFDKYSEYQAKKERKLS